MNYEQTIEAMAACGVPREKIAINYVEDFQLDVVSVQRLDASLGSAALACIYRATVPLGYDVRFEDELQNGAFWQMVFEQGREHARAEGQAWLEQRGLLEGLPRYEQSSDLTTFARAVEAHCSVPPGAALETVGDDIVTIRRDFAAAAREPEEFEQFVCLSNVLAASNMGEWGVNFGFVGNKILPRDDDR